MPRIGRGSSISSAAPISSRPASHAVASAASSSVASKRSRSTGSATAARRAAARSTGPAAPAGRGREAAGVRPGSGSASPVDSKSIVSWSPSPSPSSERLELPGRRVHAPAELGRRHLRPGARHSAHRSARRTRHSRRSHRPGDGPHCLRCVHRRLAGKWRQPVDQRSELELAEEPDYLRTVVIGEPGRFQVELDRQVANDSGEFAAGEDLLPRLDELLAQLVGLDLGQPFVDPLDRAELADELGRGLLADSGDTGNVVGRSPLRAL